MTFRNMTTHQFLILSLVVVDFSISAVIIFSDITESFKFAGLLIMFLVSAMIIMTGATSLWKRM